MEIETDNRNKSLIQEKVAKALKAPRSHLSCRAKPLQKYEKWKKQPNKRRKEGTTRKRGPLMQPYVFRVAEDVVPVREKQMVRCSTLCGILQERTVVSDDKGEEGYNL